MKKVNILESLLEIDKKTSNRYELATLYEACKLEDDDKVQLVKYIDSYEHPSLIGQFLEGKCDGLCESNCDDDDCSEIALDFEEDSILESTPVISAFDDIEENGVDDKTITEEIVLDNSRDARRYVWRKIKDIDSLTDEDSLYWQFDRGVDDGDSVKVITDEIDLPETANYRFSLIEVDINLYYDYDEACWYVLDKTYETSVLEESVEIHECPICGRNFAEHEVSQGTCPKCGEELHKTDSGEYEVDDKDLDEDMAKDLKNRYTASIESVQRYIDELKVDERVADIEVVNLHGTDLFKLTATSGKVLYLVPITTSQVDVYDENEQLLDKSEFIKYVPNEFLKETETEFVYEIVGGDFAGTYTREEVEALPCFSGKYSDDLSDIRSKGGFVHRAELDNQPELDGYVGPMMDGWAGDKMRIRYETQEVYDRLSESLYELDVNWTDYCPHCTNRTLVNVGEDKAVCDECGAEFEVVPMANGKVRLMEINDLTEGFIDDAKKVGKTVKDIAKERWNDSYTKAIATGVKKNLAKTKLGQDLKRVGNSIKDADTYKKVAGKVNDAKQAVRNNKHDDNRKPQDISMNVRGKDYRVSDLKFKLNGKQISTDDVAKMSAFERRKVQVIVPRGTKPVNEGWFSDDDFEDDIAHANLYGGDTTYCRDCGTKKTYDEDGFAYCPKCNGEVEL